MLYFSETEWTLPGMLEINMEFERDYDDREYERKIVGLIRKIELRDAGDEEQQRTWDEAVAKLVEGDNYLSLMLDRSFKNGETVRPPHDRLKLWLAALCIIFGSFGFIWFLNWAFGPNLGALLGWFEDHGLRGLPGLLMVAAIALLYWKVGPRLSGAVERLLDRGKTARRSN